MPLAPPHYSYIVEHQIRGAWDVVQRFDNDESAAQLASALSSQSPTDGVRILVEAIAADGSREITMVWEFGGVEPAPKRSSAAMAGAGPAHPPGCAGRPPTAGDKQPTRALRRKTQRDFRRANAVVGAVTAFCVIVMVTLGASFLKLEWSALGPGARPGLWPNRTSRSDEATTGSSATAAARAGKAEDDAALTALQQTVARRYAYMSCVAQHLTTGTAAIQTAYDQGRISAAMKLMYESQYNDIRNELVAGRDVISTLSRDNGGLPIPFLDFIDNWFALGRDFMKASQNAEEIINPQDYCTKRSEQATYLDAYRSLPAPPIEATDARAESAR
ncbi:MAG: hypothetical protein GC191_13760 [Azospirillum sp.]|nr:hypothetical protein [Azospirillum sp.]